MNTVSQTQDALDRVLDPEDGIKWGGQQIHPITGTEEVFLHVDEIGTLLTIPTATVVAVAGLGDEQLESFISSMLKQIGGVRTDAAVEVSAEFPRRSSTRTLNSP